MNYDLFDFIKESPTAFHTVDNICKILTSDGFVQLNEGEEWRVKKGGSYFVSRNKSSLIAFRVPQSDFKGFMIGATHSDSPCFKLKAKPDITDGSYVRLSSERYGGLINSTWLDRPLSLAGRVLLSVNEGVETRLVDIKEPVAIIPNVAIHLNRNINEGVIYNPAVDLIPLCSLKDTGCLSVYNLIADSLGVAVDNILSADLFLYNPQQPVLWGDFISSPRIDDLQCVFASLKGFVSADLCDSMPVFAVFDNEEVGSSTKQGADSDFIDVILKKLTFALQMTDVDLRDKLSNSFMLSCDNGHAVHPNHPELTDSNNYVLPNGGIVIKYNANQRYCTDAVSAALVKTLCVKAGVPYQEYSNRSDLPGGSTLGNIANTHISVVTADIGLAQFAMHSSYETAGSADTEYMAKLMNSFYSSSMTMISDGNYRLN